MADQKQREATPSPTAGEAVSSTSDKLILALLEFQKAEAERRSADVRRLEELLRADAEERRAEFRRQAELLRATTEQHQNALEGVIGLVHSISNQQSQPSMHMSRSPGQHSQLADPLTTPVRSGAARLPLPELKAVESTPYRVQTMVSSHTASSYTKLAITFNNKLSSAPLDDIIASLGESWKTEWGIAKKRRRLYDQANMEKIIDNCLDSFKKLKPTAKVGSESYHQQMLTELMKSIERSLPTEMNEGPHLLWGDTHRGPMNNRRMPDGVLSTSSMSTRREWRNVAVVFELKNDKHNPESDGLMGQLYQNFIDMARDQPRRYQLGLAVSKDSDIHVYQCTAEHVHYAKIGRLPLSGASMSHLIEIRAAVAFLLLLYVQLPKDGYGFIVPNLHGIYDSFSMTDILGRAPIYTNAALGAGYLDNAVISVSDDKAFSGRRRNAFGARSWIYKAILRRGNNYPNFEHIFKLHFYEHGMSEAEIYQRVQNIGVPHVPSLLHSSAVASDHPTGLPGEILLVEDCGRSLGSFLEELPTNQGYKVIDIIAGYFHTLLAAANGDDDGYVLHRDISMNNLLVKDGRPFIIDWGCGINVLYKNERDPSTICRVGTAPYMGIRVLGGKLCRSLMDDLESLFLVLSHCLWRKYGKADKYSADIWDCTCDQFILRDMRCQWLSSEHNYFNKMGLSKCPIALINFAAALYKLVIPHTGILVYGLLANDDPRLVNFKASEWIDALRAAMAGYGASNIHTPCLDKLVVYVDTAPGCDNVSPIVDSSSISRRRRSCDDKDEGQISISSVASRKRRIDEGIFDMDDERRIRSKTSHTNLE
ncbi:hypothetical protein H4R24_001736 [Coemansia sp. RSA 988]|nr:hypothetical protein H4R24_001736 [Coemansia sp. RSA 988]